MVRPLLRSGLHVTPISGDGSKVNADLCRELGKEVKGTVHPRGEAGFAIHSKIFNGDVKSPASVLVRPFDAEDHSLSLSVKAGGLGTHGQAIQGDVIIDVSLLNEVHIEAPKEDGGFLSLRDMDPPKRAGKGREAENSLPDGSGLPDRQNLSSMLVNLGKRNADALSTGPPGGSLIPDLNEDTGRVSKLRRTDDNPGSSSSGQGSVDTRPSNPRPTASTSGAPPAQSYQSSPFRNDPFGYLSDDLPTSAFQQDPGPLRIFDQPSAASYPHTGFGVSLPFLPGNAPASEYYMPSRVNLISPLAYMTFGAGTKQQAIDDYSAAHPLPAHSLDGVPCFTPYHAPLASHPGGASIVLLGGFGFLSRLHGLSSDNLAEVEMVLADSSIVIVSEKENPELWWAVRGAGTAFGIITRYKMKAFPVPVVFAGNLLYKFRRSTAASLIKHFRDCIKNVPRELYANVVLTAGPGGDAILVIEFCYLGTSDKGTEFLQAIMSWDGEQCLLNDVCEKSFLVQQESFSQLLRGKAGRKWFIRSDLITTLSDDIIHETVVLFADSPTGCTWLFELAGGCVSDEHEGCFPKSSRDTAWTVTAFHQWELDDEDPRCVTTAEDWMKDVLGKASVGGPFPSFYGIHEPMDRVMGSYGDNWPRLCELKRKYDPTGLFNNSFWPLDKDGLPRTAAVSTITHF